MLRCHLATQVAYCPRAVHEPALYLVDAWAGTAAVRAAAVTAAGRPSANRTRLPVLLSFISFNPRGGNISPRQSANRP